ncbi:MAG: amino acid ABC transporter ATP-binding protein [Acholeplasmatales bacterium]|nr:MAG: amino acid ABC transporter ATP-binding protein [Acholeplasmatales bacterium]
MFRVDKLSKAFGDTTVLKDATYTFVPGRTVVIIGQSGSGKSTLLRCLNGLETPTSGHVYYQDMRVSPKTLPKVRKQVGMVFQGFNLFSNMTVMDNVTYALKVVRKLDKATSETRAKRTLEQVGLADKFDAWPQTLSGGQKQRVAIARCLAMEPEVFLFDEPTSALDPEMVNEVLDVMRTITRQGFTNIIVTHEMGFAREVADDILFMSQGKIIEIADKTTFFTQPKSTEAKQFLLKIL